MINQGQAGLGASGGLDYVEPRLDADEKYWLSMTFRNGGKN